MKKIYFMRHGQSEANAAKVVAGGGMDSPLTRLGMEQAAKVGRQLEGRCPPRGVDGHDDALVAQTALIDGQARRGVQRAELAAPQGRQPVAQGAQPPHFGQ